MTKDGGARTTATAPQHLGRREAIRRAAIAAGVLVWMAPAVRQVAASTEGSTPPSPAREPAR